MSLSLEDTLPLTVVRTCECNRNRMLISNYRDDITDRMHAPCQARVDRRQIVATDPGGGVRGAAMGNHMYHAHFGQCRCTCFTGCRFDCVCCASTLISDILVAFNASGYRNQS